MIHHLNCPMEKWHASSRVRQSADGAVVTGVLWMQSTSCSVLTIDVRIQKWIFIQKMIPLLSTFEIKQQISIQVTSRHRDSWQRNELASPNSIFRIQISSLFQNLIFPLSISHLPGTVAQVHGKRPRTNATEKRGRLLFFIFSLLCNQLFISIRNWTKLLFHSEKRTL